MVFDKIFQIWRVRELRNSILFVLAMLVVFRFAANIPIPGVNREALANFFSNYQVFEVMSMFSGGGMERFSIVMMGIAPYITASIIFQLLGMIVPKLEEMQKEESGRQKITMWTRWLTVPLAGMQAFGMITLLRNSSSQILGDISFLTMISMIIVITAGTVFLMWIGELITEKKIGNGISLLIFAGIVSGLPQMLQNAKAQYLPGDFMIYVIFAVLAVLTVIGVVYLTEGQRNIPVQYAKQMRGNQSYGGSTSHLPLRVNMAGVIPIIFAISVVIFPSMVAQFFVGAKTAWIANFATWTIDIFQNQLIYGLIYFVLVFAFTFFYTEVVFHPNQIAENLQKQGGFIPGIRPGKPTSEYLSRIAYRILFVGALSLSCIAVLPLVLKAFYPQNQAIALGGTSLLIVVAVVIEMVKQIESQLSMREYDNVD
ncbi:preprotein translocase subunit SecY [Candidatus Parcubacteria bacterium]|nr:preprotein translocase subunit SecY [Candidatus Parcubacteria bacterium]